MILGMCRMLSHFLHGLTIIVCRYYNFQVPHGDPNYVSCMLFASECQNQELRLSLIRCIAACGGLSVTSLLAHRPKEGITSCSLVRAMWFFSEDEWQEFDALLLQHIPDWNFIVNQFTLFLVSIHHTHEAKTKLELERLDARAATFVTRSIDSLNVLSPAGYYSVNSVLFNGRPECMAALVKAYPMVWLDPSLVPGANTIDDTLTLAMQKRNDYNDEKGRDAATQANYKAGLTYVTIYKTRAISIVEQSLGPYITKLIPPMICDFLF